MKWRPWVLAAIVIVGSAVCVRLGFWQLARWHEKQRLNRALRASLVAPPLELASLPPPDSVIRFRRVIARGVYDERHQFVLAARSSDGSPGVDVVTPLVREGAPAVLVDRGWIYAADAATANPLAWPEPGGQAVVGLVRAPDRRRPIALRRLPYGHDSAAVWSTLVLDPDTASRRLGYPVAPWIVRALPGPGVPPEPRRAAPKPYDELMHISYAVQWFAFAAILGGGSLALAVSRRRAARASS